MQWSNPSGFVAEWGPGDHVRRWRSGQLKAHDFIQAYSVYAYHSPGLGKLVSLSPTSEILAPGDWVEVINRSPSAQETVRRLWAAGSNCGVEWSLAANCQDFCSFVVTGKTGSFQRDGLVVACL